MGTMLLRVLSDAEVEKMHARTLEVFESVGVKITHAEALSKLTKAGARVNEHTGIAKIPAGLVEESIQQAPQVIYATGLNGKTMEVGGDNRYYLSLVLDPYVVDYDQGLRRPVLEDVRRHTIIGESLARVNASMRMQFPVSDVPEPDSYYKTMEIFLSHHTKHTFIYPTSEENCRDWMDIMEVIADTAGLDVNSTVAVAVTSPLLVHGVNVEIMKMALERGYPIIPTVCPMAGTTSPYSVAGTALIANVEALLAVIITQVYKPGHPVFYDVGPSSTDMRTGHDLYYRAEKVHFKIIATQMGKYYRLPLAGEAGGTLTHRADVQNGAESMAYLLAALAGGQNIIGGLGSLHNANGMSAEQIIMQCGLVDMAEYITQGVDMDEAKLALESIRAAGPGGNFLTDQLTVDLLRSEEFFTSPYLDLTAGYEHNALGMYEKSHQTAADLVRQYKPTVPEKIRTAIRGFFQEKYTSPALVDLGW